MPIRTPNIAPHSYLTLKAQPAARPHMKLERLSTREVRLETAIGTQIVATGDLKVGEPSSGVRERYDNEQVHYRQKQDQACLMCGLRSGAGVWTNSDNWLQHPARCLPSVTAWPEWKAD